MKTHDTIAGNYYGVTSPNGCTVTDEYGALKKTIEAGDQLTIQAPGAQLIVDDDEAIIRKSNFKYAASALRLLGGGVSTALPSGYLAAEFLENDSYNAYMTLPMGINTQNNKIEVEAELYPIKGSEPAAGDGEMRNISYGFWNMSSYMYTAPGVARAFGSVKKNNWTTVSVLVENKQITLFSPDGGSLVNDMSNEISIPTHYLWRAGVTERMLQARRKKHTYKFNGEYLYELIPALSPTGIPCMFDKVREQPFYNSGTGSFIIGMTLEQARKLGKLPAGGGTLKVSLPSNYLEDEGVTNAIAAANEKGWNITVASTWDATGAASTFALRRIWVRKTQNEQGSYIDADGVRWMIESCVAMYNADGSEPDAHGYETFRSVESATEYWGLTAWVDPEAEEELLTNTDEV